MDQMETRSKLFTLVAILVAMLPIAGCTAPTSPGKDGSNNANVTPIASTPTTNRPTIPPPVGTATYDPIPTLTEPSVPPSVTPEPPPPSPPPLPTPPRAEAVTPGPYPSVSPYPTASISARANTGTGLPANIAWGVETKDDLTIWIGSYSDDPTPSITDTKAIVRWGTPLTLLDMAVSPDRQSLAVLSTSSTVTSEGGNPNWLSVINLADYSVRSIPDYNNSELYDQYFYAPPSKLLGWLDNDRLAVEQAGEGAVIATTDGASYSRVSFPPSATAPDTALSPDRTSFFSAVYGQNDGLWLYNIDGSNPQEIGAIDSTKPVYDPIWSPDSKNITFLSPKTEKVDGADYVNSRYMNVYVLDLGAKSQKPISGENVWDVAPAWSLDSSRIAFLRADAPITDIGNVWYKTPEKIDTGIFVANLSDLIPHRLVGSPGKNSGLQWTPGDNIILSSTIGSSNGLPQLVAIFPDTGATVTLAGSSATGSLTHPLIFK